MPSMKTMTPVAIAWTESSRKLVARTQALLEETCSLIALNRRLLNPWWALSGSSDDDAQGERLLSVLARLERGTLVPAPHELRAGKGTGQTCIICTKTIHSDEVENEAVVRGGGVTVTFWAHFGCLNVWLRATWLYETRRPSPTTNSMNGHPA